MDVLGKYEPQVYAVTRFVTGLLFAGHGAMKVLGWPAGGPGKMPIGSVPGIAGIIELVTGLMIALGFFAGLAAFIASGEMAVAYFMAHFSKGGPNPYVNQGELAALYCFLWLYVSAHGSGIWSIDAALRRGRTAPRGR
ncbi:MAG: DoxX family protein [Acidobacteria bacterium]|nr:DoxX family protein [Acidobacteriota bacterium]